MTQLSDLELMFQELLRCCLHQPVWTPTDATEVLCSVWHGDDSGGWADCLPDGADGCYSWKTCSESSSYTVVQLKDGGFGLLSESEDYTGHGCQCGAATSTYSSLDDVLRFGVEDLPARMAIWQRLSVRFQLAELLVAQPRYC